VALCACGCGRETNVITHNQTRENRVKGEFSRYIRGHHMRGVSLKKDIHTRYTVDPDTGCWLWQGDRSPKGYGSIKTPSGQRLGVHRYFYELYRGPIPDGLEIDHLCRRRNCVNPEHMEAVTHLVNIRRGLAARSKES
jgi:hypothetical protein